jgi:hypothetical protein
MVAKTGLSVREHQRRTVANYRHLKQLGPELPIIPVVQGWQLDDYLRCIDLYTAASIDLTAEPLVGVGSICRRQGTAEIAAIIKALHDRGLRLHGFGVKTIGLSRYGQYLASADSMAWSLHGRRQRGCCHRAPHQGALASEANCLHFARQWRQRLLGSRPRPNNVNGEQHA